jgi:two-component system response regulator HydG
MQRLLTLAARVAPLDATVLVTGETGVGKERLARWLHDASPRASGTFIAVNCGAFPDALLDSELFGHLRGAFTGALTDRAGLIEAAHRGTLFLDEIGDTSQTMQVKLLRVLQEREVRRVGDVKTRRVDFRLIAATNRDLDEEVAQNRFRPDLLYRLRVIELTVPALRRRPEDLPRLAAEILERTVRHLKRGITGYTTRAFDCLLQYGWPGNIRELEHAIERACALCDGSIIDVEDLPDSVRGYQNRTIVQSLADRERTYIRGVLDRHGGRRVAAAKELGISLSTLKRRLRTLR